MKEWKLWVFILFTIVSLLIWFRIVKNSSDEPKLYSLPIEPKSYATEKWLEYPGESQWGRIRLGMSKEQVMASWRRPSSINRSVGSWGVHEQWSFYVYSTHKHIYLYFEDGVLTSWQD